MKTSEKNDNLFDESVLKVLACPLCYETLNYMKKEQVLCCEKCDKKYPIKKGIPILMPEQL